MRVLEPHGIKPTTVTGWWIRISTLLLVALCPWWYGTVTWEAQSYAIAFGLLLAASMAIHCVMAYAAGEVGWAPNWLAWTLFGIGCFALLQSQSRYSWLDADGIVPPSVQMQRWALGLAEAPDAIREGLVTRGSEVPSGDGAIACGLENVSEDARRLAISVEPITSRAAAACLFLSAVMVWIGSSLFCKKAIFPSLLLCLTLVGVGVALVGIVGALLPKQSAWFWLKSSSSFATFVSRNSAGAFLNVAAAASLGLVYWTIRRVPRSIPHHRDHRHQMPWKQRLTLALQEFFSHLDASQIAAWIGLIIIISALLMSLSRGAAIAGLVAIIGTIALSFSGKRSGAVLMASIIVGGLCLAFIVGFQMDERIVDRIESIGEFDVESDARAGRIYIWGVSWNAARFYSWLGSGLGTFHFATLPFQSPTFSGWYYHAESIFAEVMVTLGYLGLLSTAVAIAVCFGHLRRIYVSERFREFVPLQMAGFYLLFSQVIHGAVDFAIILPGVFLPAALLIGAALGADFESHRMIQKLKRRRTEPTRAPSEETELGYDKRLLAMGCMLMAIGSMAAMNYCRFAVVQLAAAESIQRTIAADDALPLEDRMTNRVEHFIDATVDLGGDLTMSPQLMRLLAEAINFDGRMQQWLNRPRWSDPQSIWNETSPFVVRIALDRAVGDDREALLETIGGKSRLASLDRANEYFARGQALSPLDWRLVWGRITTAVSCPTSKLALLVPVMQRTSSHLPQLLTSTSILFRDELSHEDRAHLWQVVVRTSPQAAIGVGRVMASMYTDGSVPLDLLPNHAPILRQIANTVFPATQFPVTNAELRNRIFEASRSLSLPVARKAMWMADVASEAGKLDEEIEQLTLYLQFNTNDVGVQVRLIERLIAAGDYVEAKQSLRRLSRSEPNNPAIKRLTDLIEAGG